MNKTIKLKIEKNIILEEDISYIKPTNSYIRIKRTNFYYNYILDIINIESFTIKSKSESKKNIFKK